MMFSQSISLDVAAYSQTFIAREKSVEKFQLATIVSAP